MDCDTGTEVNFRWGHHDAWPPDSTGCEEPEQTDQEEQFVSHRLIFLTTVEDSSCRDSMCFPFPYRRLALER